ncbi:MAG: alpha/beta hydrolase [Lachnospiraceae bacterium]|nr:alpha/beta hydrolase [Lachnospiraceae bacterium]MDE7436620.1 alpha/beta hydrolase [Lachnospiraceae bacterium]
MGALKNIVAAAGLLAAAGIGETVYFYNRTMKRGKAKTERTMKMAGTDWEKYFPLMEERKGYVMAQPHRDVYTTSFDGLKLHATYFPAAGTSDIRKAVICFHGYTGEGLSNHIAIADYFLKHGYAMLLPDARAHGESEGEYIGFGCLDRQDALGWIKWLIQECGKDVEIMLHGTSMGGATVLMASGLDLPDNVRGIVADCGFTSPKEVFTHVLNHMYHLPAFPAIQGADLMNRRFAGYGMDECNAKYEVEKAKVPILFIHGSADTFVPCSMCHEIYRHCSSPKRKLIVEGAAHAESYYKDMKAYEQALDEFAEDIFQTAGNEYRM